MLGLMDLNEIPARIIKDRLRSTLIFGWSLFKDNTLIFETLEIGLDVLTTQNHDR